MFLTKKLSGIFFTGADLKPINIICSKLYAQSEQTRVWGLTSN